MNQYSLSDLLLANPWFERLEKAQFDKMVSIASDTSWAAGETIFREGGNDPHLYLLISGHVVLEIHVPGRGRISILTVGENELFGWSSILPVASIKMASARAIQASQAVAFNAHKLVELSEADHELGFHVYRRLTNVVAGRLAATRFQLLDVYAMGSQGDN